MGIPTWIVTPIMPYYTWAVPGSTSRWYDSVRLFRQTKYGEWDVPFQEIREELTKLAEKK
jgi:predicted esterase